MSVRNVTIVGLISNGYGATDIWTSNWFEPYAEHQCWSCFLNDKRKSRSHALPAWRGTPHFRRHVMEYPNQQCPYWWIGRGGQQNRPLRSPDLTRLDFHERCCQWCKVNKREACIVELLILQGAWIVNLNAFWLTDFRNNFYRLHSFVYYLRLIYM
jgi:hypothetical protein